MSKQRAGEVRLEAERRRLREALEAAEARGTRVELGRRSLEGELQRLKLSLGDREAESQATQERHDVLLKQVTHWMDTLIHMSMNRYIPDRGRLC